MAVSCQKNINLHKSRSSDIGGNCYVRHVQFSARLIENYSIMSNNKVLKTVDVNVRQPDTSPPRKRGRFNSSTKKRLSGPWSLNRKDLTLDEIYDCGFALLDSVESHDDKIAEENNRDLAEELMYNTPRKRDKENQLDSSLLKNTMAKISLDEDDVYLKKSSLNKEGIDYFELLPDEVILQIFYWLPKRSLTEIAVVCKRFHRLTQDESLWTRMDVSSRNLEPGALGQILSRQVIILRLAQSKIADPPFLPGQKPFNIDFKSRLLYLDLSMAYVSKKSLSLLFATCYRLKKVSLEHVPVNDKVLLTLSMNKDIEVLNLAMVEGITGMGMVHLLSNLRKLRELNLAWTYLSSNIIKYTCLNLPSSLDRLNFSGCRKQMIDSNVFDLVTSCPRLRELDLSDCTGLTGEAIHHICLLEDLNFLALSRCYLIPYGSLLNLNKINSLVYLDIHGGYIDSKELEVVQEALGSGVHLNKFKFSSVARPTVGPRRSSIWGLRVRD